MYDNMLSKDQYKYYLTFATSPLLNKQNIIFHKIMKVLPADYNSIPLFRHSQFDTLNFKSIFAKLKFFSTFVLFPSAADFLYLCNNT